MVRSEFGHMSKVSEISRGKTYISQGEFAIDGGDKAVISTLLGSCVSACIWDMNRSIGGMNHVLFVDSTNASQEAFGHGVNAMELLINGLLRLGANRSNLRAKVFGGARMIGGLTDAGDRNAEFVCSYLAREQIVQVASNIGGTRARRLEFFPGSGRVRMKLVEQDVPHFIEKKVRPIEDIEIF